VGIGRIGGGMGGGLLRCVGSPTCGRQGAWSGCWRYNTHLRLSRQRVSQPDQASELFRKPGHAVSQVLLATLKDHN
jgi:hypothetical protein